MEIRRPIIDEFPSLPMRGKFQLAAVTNRNLGKLRHIAELRLGDKPQLQQDRDGRVTFQFCGISPTDGSTEAISISPPGNFYAAIYAPNADVTITGNPDIFGGIVCHNFSGNGNTGFRYDKQLGLLLGHVTDYQIASYIEDIR